MFSIPFQQQLFRNPGAASAAAVAAAAAAAAANLAAAQTANSGQLALLQQQQLFAQSLAAGKETKCSNSNSRCQIRTARRLWF